MNDEAILDLLKSDPERSWHLKEILQKANVPETRLKALRRFLKELVERGELDREPGRRYRISRAGQTMVGRIEYDERGRSQIVSDDKRREAFLVHPEDAEWLSKGDKVRATLVRSGPRGLLFARVDEFVERPQKREIGLFRKIGKALFIEPEMQKDRRGSRSPVLIDPNDYARLSPVDGQLVAYEIVEPASADRAAVARLISVLGDPGDRATEIQRLLLEYGLPLSFPEDVQKEADAYGHAPSAEEVANRRDLRELPLVTIDGIDARDFDDAVCAEPYGRHSFKLYVAIADVSYYVRPNRPLDREAMARGTSTYLPDRVIPMLPEALSNELCSLRPDVERLCMVAEMEIDRDGRTLDTQIYRAVMRSRARLTYEQVAAALEGRPDEVCQRLLPSLLRLEQVARFLRTMRTERGAMNLELAEPQIIFDAEGLPIDTKPRARNEAHKLIEDLMLAANEAVAGFFEERKLPTLYRIHEDPDPDKLETFLELCDRLGLDVQLKKKRKKKLRPADVAKVVRELIEHPEGKFLQSFLLRSMAQARYSPDNIGHFGLGAERYLHFTSPIRRYPDLMVHRLLAIAQGESDEQPLLLGTLRDIGQKNSDAERKAMVAERAFLELDRAYVAAAHLGRHVEVTITSIQSFGCFAQTFDPFIEGLIPIRMLGDEFFEADPLGTFLRGTRTGRTIQLGGVIEVEIAQVDIVRRQVTFRPLSFQKTMEEDAARPRRAPSARGRSDRGGADRPKPGGTRGRPAAPSGAKKKAPRRRR